LTFSEFNDVSNSDTISIWSDSPIVIRHRKEGDKIDLGSHHKKLRRLFIDNKPINDSKISRRLIILVPKDCRM